MKAFVLLVFACSAILIQYAKSDIYMHNPSGSNNRLHGRGANRQNANRLFDSQNNNKGGYNVGETEPQARHDKQYSMSYFMNGPGGSNNSILQIEWTNQHGCGDGDLNCNIVLQYMCQAIDFHKERDADGKDRKVNGYTEDTIPYSYLHEAHLTNKWTKINHKRGNVKTDRNGTGIYGQHEPWEWYDKCNRRLRNKRLFTADQKLRGLSSKYTRQNPNGQRRGYECPEERDYYPYFHPTDWIDIAVLANKQQDCSYYRTESFNTKPKGECMEKYSRGGGWKHYSIYNNKQECQAKGKMWVEFSNYLEKRPQYSTKTACEAATTPQIPLIWAIPYRSEDIDKFKSDVIDEWYECLVKLDPPECRTAPYSRSNHLGNGEGVTPLTYKWKLPYYPSGRKQACVLRIRYNISTNDPESKIVNDPIVKLDVGIPLQLAINTAQFGRTFEDRSHIFHLVSRTGTEISNKCDTLYNLNVRGKRGNIVQAYPAVEYDFVPKRMKIGERDCVHIQWTGANTNPGNNAGEGTRGTDRSNVVQMRNASYSFPLDPNETADMFGEAKIIWVSDDVIKSNEDLELSMASAGYYKRSQDINTKKASLNTQLNNASPSFYGAVVQMKKGTYYLMCTRNNNFTNRSQKGRLTVS